MGSWYLIQPGIFDALEGDLLDNLSTHSFHEILDLFNTHMYDLTGFIKF